MPGGNPYTASVTTESRVPRKAKTTESATLTIHDVARHAGVSSMTVSRVINKNVNVREPLRERVMASIKALNYSLNMAARSTRAGLSGARIGILYSTPSAGFLNDILIGALEQCSRTGGQLLLEQCTSLASQKAALKRLTAKGVDAIILPPPLCDSEPTVNLLQKAGIPVLALATAHPLAEVSAVHIDDFAGAAAMTRHLIKLGHRRIAFIRGAPEHTPSGERYKGFLDAMAAADLGVDPALVVDGNFTYQSGLQAAEQLLSLDNAPTAIFASNDDMAAAVIAVAHGRRIFVPEDLSVCGFDDTPVASAVWPQITTIHQPKAAMGRTAVMTLLEEVRDIKNGKPLNPRQIKMKFTLIERGSTAPARDLKLFRTLGEGGMLPR